MDVYREKRSTESSLMDSIQFIFLIGFVTQGEVYLFGTNYLQFVLLIDSKFP